jgi:hypothetical protein
MQVGFLMKSLVHRGESNNEKVKAMAEMGCRRIRLDLVHTYNHDGDQGNEECRVEFARANPRLPRNWGILCKLPNARMPFALVVCAGLKARCLVQTTPRAIRRDSHRL